jgi:sortase A
MRIGRAARPLVWTVAACVLFTAGWATYMVTDPFAGQRQRALQHQLYQQWGEGPAVGGGGAAGPLRQDRIRLRTGRPFALIRIPAFGRNWQFAIVQGTGASQLALGPGHVPGSALPGQLGNFAVAAHDITAGNAFLHLGSLRPPDRILIYTRRWEYEYVVRSERVVRYTDVAVEYPVPGHPHAPPHHALITLITCTPATLTFTPWRIVVTGQLESAFVWRAPLHAATLVAGASRSFKLGSRNHPFSRG